MRKINYWQNFEEDGIYHLYNRGINGTTIFSKPENYHFFLKKWKALIHSYFETLAFCLMPNHIHLLIKVRPISEELMDSVKSEVTSKGIKFFEGSISHNEFLEDQFKRLFSSYALAFNKQEGRTGSLFQKRFKRILIKNEFKLWHILAYIHHNPIHHKFATNFSSWKFSSYKAFLSGKPTLVSKKFVLSWFDKDFEKSKVEFIKYHEDFRVDLTENDYLE